MTRVARVAVVALLGCRPPEPVSPEPPSTAGHDEVTLLLDDVIVTATPLDTTVRSAIHGGVLLESRPVQHTVGLQDRGTLAVTVGTERCGGDLDGEVAVTTCGNLIVVYQEGTVTLISRTPNVEVLGQARVPGDDRCGTHEIDASALVRTTKVEIHGYRNVRCSGTPAPLIF